ncbi:hypothetical protein EGN82_04730 [Salmonella enterica subsp. enterica serovar Potsdam]|uniref:Uncharacterized protein n=1 Tax=Salmonella potsdam TaxID=597 RepID=A0A5I2XF61_SALPO|nr:hypothetical protein [Salmonella enterica subsp. enterica serovar Potsdam]EAA8207411.1 hypothetical protein [Salmonella enterica subsp. enterica]EAN5315159.1 hypothetical protein [Salmonella enterica]EBS4558488.1 hypothetical protein [Salmonella enterica subsp. enterica serovar Kintambo]EBV5820716.1 hypothetical protein [Salmonella enterica subsp. enterica serovar Cubana]
MRFLLFPRTHNHQEYIQFLPEHSHYSLFSAGLFFCLLMICTGIWRDMAVREHGHIAHHNHY